MIWDRNHNHNHKFVWYEIVIIISVVSLNPVLVARAIWRVPVVPQMPAEFSQHTRKIKTAKHLLVSVAHTCKSNGFILQAFYSWYILYLYNFWYIVNCNFQYSVDLKLRCLLLCGFLTFNFTSVKSLSSYIYLSFL